MSISRVVGDVLPADGVCVARKLCPCTRSRQTHTLGSVGAFPNALKRRKVPQRTPHSAQKRPIKSNRVGPQHSTVPQRKGHPLGNIVKADDRAAVATALARGRRGFTHSQLVAGLYQLLFRVAGGGGRSSEVMAAYIEGGTLQCRPRACRSLADSFPYIDDDEQPR